MPLFVVSQQQQSGMMSLASQVETPSGPMTVNISMNGVDWKAGMPMPSGWQEYREKDAGNPSGFLQYSDGTTSAYKIEIVNTATGRDDGTSTGNNTGIIPDSALMRCLATNISNTWYHVKITGMDNKMTYTIKVVGSIDKTWNWLESYQIGEVTKSHSPDQNTSLSSVFTNVSAIEGEIEIGYKGTNCWALLNAIMIIEE